ncbi:hypothetical protein INS49_004278 [Diaporthe citri]|uniref:uncharacterized protein n=1 Tax=Diaporthe citri TaxID=83186 RepID=UPI001C7E99F0|nr:uncharacterized protein INS49_004278 [Diaporthe citri]KAG6355197.1 hypothetical protein INS49_004278 [Diaporthe citri]
MSSAQQPQQRDITIVGGGIIGCCTAYFLTRHPSYSPATHRITLLEAASTSSGGRTEDSITDPGTLADPARVQKLHPAHNGIAGGSSGKAGGLLAKWAFPSNIVPLSFRLHDELAREHDGAARWLPEDAENTDGVTRGLHKDHRKTISKLKKLGAPEDLDWLDTEHSLVAYDGMGTPDDTAQVHPELFTRSMAQLAEEKGVKIITGARVTAITNGSNGHVESVTYTKDGQDEQLPTTDCIVAAGPWTARLLPSVPVTSFRAHSIVIKTPRPVSPYALFTSIALPAGFPSPAQGKPLKRAQTIEPEIYPRPDGTVYASGGAGIDLDVPLPLTTAEVEVDRATCDEIAVQAGAISDELGRDGHVVARQACYLPQGGPFIGPVPGHKGVMVAAGHTCWGIQNAPGTGKLVSELVFEGKANILEHITMTTTDGKSKEIKWESKVISVGSLGFSYHYYGRHHRSSFTYMDTDFHTIAQMTAWTIAQSTGEERVADEIMTGPGAGYTSGKWDDMGLSMVADDTSTAVYAAMLATMAKFMRTKPLFDALVSTGDKVFVDISCSSDSFWSIGYIYSDMWKNIDKWGQNQLGKILMVVRFIASGERDLVHGGETITDNKINELAAQAMKVYKIIADSDWDGVVEKLAEAEEEIRSNQKES